MNKDGTSTDNTDTNEATVVSGSSSITVSDGASKHPNGGLVYKLLGTQLEMLNVIGWLIKTLICTN